MREEERGEGAESEGETSGGGRGRVERGGCRE